MTVAAVLLPMGALAALGGAWWGARRLMSDAAVSVPWWVWVLAPVLALLPLLVPLAYVVVGALILDRLDIVAKDGLVDRTLDVVLGMVDSLLDWVSRSIPGLPGLVGVG